MSKILVFVPNTASSDRRVIRQANSLKEAGHTVEIVGVATSDKSAKNAITDEQIPITRINWRAATYRKIFLTISSTYLVVAVAALAALLVLAWIVIGAGYKWFNNVLSPDIALNGFHIPNSFLYFGLLITSIALVVFLIFVLRIIRNRGPVANLVRAQQVATNYARIEQDADSMKEPLIFRALKWAANRSKRHKDLTFKATIEARINAMTEYGLEWQPDIAYCHEAATLPVGKALKSKLACKLVYDAHEIYDDLASASPVQSKTYQDIHSECFEHVDHFITVNPKILEFYLETYPQITNYTVMPNTVFPDNSAKYDGRLHEAAGLSPEKNILLYQGGFSPERGLDKLVEAAISLPEDWYLVMMGWGRLEKHLKQKANLAKRDLIDAFRYEKFQELLTSDQFLDMMSSITSLQIKTGDEPSTMQPPMDMSLTEENGQVSTNSFPQHNSEKLLSADFLQTLLTTPHDELEMVGIEPTIISKIMAESLRMERSGVFEKTRFIPGAPHDELVAWSKGATIGAIPYENVGANHWNCSPNKIWEYANAGTPILASRLNFTNEIIEKYRIGWTIATDFTDKDIASKIARITDSDIKEKTKNCKAFIEQDSYYKYEPKLIEIFETLTNK